MLLVRKMNPEDFSFAAELANTMKWNMNEEDFKFSLDLEPNGCFILLKNQERIGLSTCISYGKVGWFGNLIVKEAYREQGAGACLVHHAISYLKTMGATTIGLYAYLNLLEFYAKIGFNRDTDFVVLKAKNISSSPISESTKKIKCLERDDFGKVLNFDIKGFGAERRKTLEPIFRNTDNYCFVALEDNQLIGYIGSKVFDAVTEIGPLVCNQNQAYVASDLLQTLLSKLDGSEAYLYLPASEADLLNIAYKAGFRIEFFLARMFLGSVVAQDWVCAAESLERG